MNNCQLFIALKWEINSVYPIRYNNHLNVRIQESNTCFKRRHFSK